MEGRGRWGGLCARVGLRPLFLRQLMAARATTVISIGEVAPRLLTRTPT